MSFRRLSSRPHPRRQAHAAPRRPCGHRSALDKPLYTYDDSSSSSDFNYDAPPLIRKPSWFSNSDASKQSSTSLESHSAPWYEFIGMKTPSTSEMNSPYLAPKGSAKNPISITSSMSSDYPDGRKSQSSSSRHSVTTPRVPSLKRSRSNSTIGSAASLGSLSSARSDARQSTTKPSASSHAPSASSISASNNAGKHGPEKAKTSRKSSINEVLPGLTIRSGMLVSSQSVRDGVDFDSYDFHETTQVHRMRCIPSECNRKLWDEAHAKAKASASSSKRPSRKNSLDKSQFTYGGSISSGHSSASSISSGASKKSGSGIPSHTYEESRMDSSAQDARGRS